MGKKKRWYDVDFIVKDYGNKRGLQSLRTSVEASSVLGAKQIVGRMVKVHKFEKVTPWR